MGRVEKLYYKNFGDYVKKGLLFYDLYSEDFNNVKQEYILVLDKKKIFINEIVIDFDQLIQSVKNKLLLWGLNEVQVNELVNIKKIIIIIIFYSIVNGYIIQFDICEGDYVMEGGIIVKLVDFFVLWVEVQVYIL